MTAERWELELLLGGVAKQIATLCERVLGEAKIDPKALSAVIASGGMSLLNAIGGRIAGSLGPHTEGIETLNGPALGAALRAAALAGRIEGPEVNDGEEEPAEADPPSEIRSAIAVAATSG